MIVCHNRYVVGLKVNSKEYFYFIRVETVYGVGIL